MQVKLLGNILLVNLSNIFEFVFAYVGFTAALSLISMKLSIGKAWLILITAILISFSFAIMILAALGIFFTVMSGKFSGDNQGVDNDERRF